MRKATLAALSLSIVLLLPISAVAQTCFSCDSVGPSASGCVRELWMENWGEAWTSCTATPIWSPWSFVTNGAPNFSWDCDEVMEWCGQNGWTCECGSTGQGTAAFRYRVGYQCSLGGYWCGAVLLPPGASMTPAQERDLILEREIEAGQFASTLQRYSPDTYDQTARDIDSRVSAITRELDRVVAMRDLYRSALVEVGIQARGQ